jgi:type IV secretion system protein VirD4
MKEEHKKALIGLVVVLVAALAAWLSLVIAGWLFVLFAKVHGAQVTWKTWLSYWSWYHHVPAVKKRLVISLLFGALLPFGLPIFAYAKMNEKKQTLFGEARFATDEEIRKAGLM